MQTLFGTVTQSSCPNQGRLRDGSKGASSQEAGLEVLGAAGKWDFEVSLIKFSKVFYILLCVKSQRI